MNLRSLVLAVSAVIVLMIAPWAVIADDGAAQRSVADHNTGSETPYKPKTKSELRRKLTAMQYGVTQNEATEPAFRNKYWNNHREGVYHCIVCGNELFSSETKFKSGTGWPSFYEPLGKKQIGTRTDWRLFYSRVEVHCDRCGAHLGHVFDDGPQPTGQRYCMNSASLKFSEKSKKVESGKVESDKGDSKEEAPAGTPPVR